ncbi:hypothetical protein E2I00_015669 [Balaenoptera physalus]|uniref:TNFR-Cys domain-containing protein n=1 Tax=Balaenoptera physalus TaxID=9770 RepID=A0A643C5P3_BALPH|nr:hypothetical protein E2I00_015669 [Balaenoptera physalus]
MRQLAERAGKRLLGCGVQCKPGGQEPKSLTSSLYLGLQIQREGTTETDTSCICNEGQHCTSHTCESCTPHSLCLPGFGVKQIGFQNRTRALVVIPITMVILFTVLLVSTCIGKMIKKQETKVLHPKAERQDPVETIDPEDFLGPHSTPPVQETLHWCQPVAQEDGKESRISVQERE